MNLLKRTSYIALVIVMVLAMCLVGCTQKSTTDKAKDTTPTSTKDEGNDSETTETSDVDLSKEVALKTWLLGDTPVDNDLVYGALNEILKEKLNTTLDINYIPWSDHQTKYQLLFASGEKFDQCYTAFWTTPTYQVLATKNAFMELTPEMMQKYAPGAYAQVPEAAWKQVTVNGGIYTFPKSAKAFDYKGVVLIRGDLREKYDLPECNTLDNLTLYLTTIAEKEEGIVPYQVEELGNQIHSLYYTQPNNYVTMAPAYLNVDVTDPEQKLTSMLDDPKFLEFCEMMKSFRDKGVIPSDAASRKSSSSSGEAFIAGKSAAFIWNVNLINAYNTVQDEHPEWKPEIYDPSPNAATFPTPYRDGVAISPTSDNWERVLMVQEQIRTEKSLWDLTNYGIEGTHWAAVGDDKYTALPDAKNFPANGSCQWGWQTEFQRYAENMPQSYVDIESNWHDMNTENFYLNGFAIDATEFKSVQAVLENLATQYYNPLTLGAFDDPAKTIEELKSKQMDAGLTEYIEACNVQAAAFAERMK